MVSTLLSQSFHPGTSWRSRACKTSPTGLSNNSKRQVDPWGMGAAGFGDLVQPEMLGRPAHQQQAAVRQVHRSALLRVELVLELEPAGRAETDGGDDRIGP